VRHDAAPVRVPSHTVTCFHGVKKHCHAQLEKALDAQRAHLGGVQAHVAELGAEGAQHFLVHDLGVRLTVNVTREVFGV
jgi:hypothetical protein